VGEILGGGQNLWKLFYIVSHHSRILRSCLLPTDLFPIQGTFPLSRQHQPTDEFPGESQYFAAGRG